MADNNDQRGSASEPLIQWSFSEFRQHSRGNGWFVWFGIITAIVIGISLFTNNYLFAIIIILFVLIIFLQNWKRPRKILFAITPQGIEVDGSKIFMRDISEFWIVYSPPDVEKVYFQFHSILRPALGVDLEGQNPLQIREILIQYLPENLDKEEEPFSDEMARYFKL